VKKDLRVHVDEGLSFKGHLHISVTKANSVLGVIRRTFSCLDKGTFTQLYKSMVRPILEYGHSVWNPSLKGLAKDLEQVQRRATRMLSCLKDLSDEQRLRALNLPCHEHSRQRDDTFKFLKGIYQSQRPKFTKPQSTSHDTRGNREKLFKKNFASARVPRSFSQREWFWTGTAYQTML